MVSIQRSNPEFIVKLRYLRRNALAVALPGDSGCSQTATDFSWPDFVRHFFRPSASLDEFACIRLKERLTAAGGET